MGFVTTGKEVGLELLQLVVGGPAEPALLAIARERREEHRVHVVGNAPAGDEQVPAALVDRVFLGAARDQRGPVHRLHVDVEAGLLEQLRHHRRKLVEHCEVGRVHQHHGLAVIPCLLEQRLGLFELRLAGEVARLVGGEGRAAGVDGRAAVVQLLVHQLGAHQRLLVDGHEGGLRDLRVVEGRDQVVQVQRERALRHGAVERDGGVVLERGVLLGGHPLDHVDLAVGQRIGLRLRVLQHDPLHAVDVHVLATGRARRRLGARHVFGVLQVDDLFAGAVFVLLEDVGAGAGGVVDLLVGRRGGHARRHDEGRVRRRLAQRVEHHAEGLLEDEPEAVGIDRLGLVQGGEHLLAQAVALAPSLERGEHVVRGDGLAVMEGQALAQREGPGLAVGAGRELVDHLRQHLALGVHAEERVVHHVAVVARDEGGGPDRVEDLQVGLWHEAQHLAGVLREGGGRCRGQQGTCEQGFQLSCLQHGSVLRLKKGDASAGNAGGAGIGRRCGKQVMKNERLRSEHGHTARVARRAPAVLLPERFTLHAHRAGLAPSAAALGPCKGAGQRSPALEKSSLGT
ncbi:hypothetical protein D9M72_398440 [compost metagenome]